MATVKRQTSVRGVQLHIKCLRSVKLHASARACHPLCVIIQPDLMYCKSVSPLCVRWWLLIFSEQLWCICVWTPVLSLEWLRGFAYVCGRVASALTARQHWLISGYMRQRHHLWYHSANLCTATETDYSHISIISMPLQQHPKLNCCVVMHPNWNKPYVAKQPLNLAAS